MTTLTKFSYQIYLYKFFGSLVFVFPFYALMFIDNGITGVSLATLLIIWKSTTIILELPSGIIADRYSRKAQLIASRLFLTLMLALWFFSKDFAFAALGFVCWGISSALHSGTYEAFIYDFLKDNELESKYKKIKSNATTFAYIGTFLSGIIASILFTIGSYNLTIAISIISLLVAASILAFVKESKIHKSTGEKESIRTTFTSLKEMSSNKVLLGLITVIAFVIAVGNPIDEYTTVFVKASGIDLNNIGYFEAVLGLFGIAGAQLGQRLSLNSTNIRLLLTFEGIIIVLASFLMNLFSVVIILLDIIIYQIFDISIDNNIQKEVPSKYRATVSSVTGLLGKIVSLVLFLIYGLLDNFGGADKGTQYGFYFLGALFLIFVSVWYTLSKIQKTESVLS